MVEINACIYSAINHPFAGVSRCSALNAIYGVGVVGRYAGIGIEQTSGACHLDAFYHVHFGYLLNQVKRDSCSEAVAGNDTNFDTCVLQCVEVEVLLKTDESIDIFDSIGACYRF